MRSRSSNTVQLNASVWELVVAVRDALASINDLDEESFVALDSQAVLKLMDAQSALEEAERLIYRPLMDRAIERAKSHA